jgi:RNA polymerase sigma-70 factor (ECF subfamily)
MNEELVDGAKVRPVQTLEDVFRTTYARLVTSLYAFTGDLAEAQDAVQEAFVRAVGRERRVMSAQSPEAYLCTMARNVARRRWTRAHKLAQRMQQEQPDQSALTPSPDRVAVIQALGELPPAQREALVRYHFGDQSVDDIADALGVSPGTVKSRLSRGRTAMVELLDDTVDDLPAGVRATADEMRSDVAAAVGTVDVPAIQSAGRRRQTRQRMTAGGAAALIAAAASVLVLLSLAPAKIAPVAPVVPVRGPLISQPVSLTAGLTVQSEMPVDVDSSYAVVDLGQQRYALARTHDAGRTWQAWSLPDPLQGGRWKKRQIPAWAGLRTNPALPDTPVVLNPQAVLIGTFITRDGGETWAQSVPGGTPAPEDVSDPPAIAVGSAVPEIPSGWRIGNRCGKVSCVLDGIDPATGIHHPLAHQPAPGRLDGVTRDTDSWMWTFDGQTGKTALSWDNGRSWRPGPQARGETFAAMSGRFAYIVTSVTPDPSTFQFSDDEGHTWHTQPQSNVVVRSNVFWSADDGTLYAYGRLAGDPDQTHIFPFVSWDHGRTFERTNGPAGVQARFRTVTGAYAVTTVPGGIFAAPPKPGWTLISANGRSFTPVRLPAGPP